METEESRRSTRPAGFLSRWLLVLVALLGLQRSVYFLLYAACSLPSPQETHHFEAKSVHLAWRVQSGLPLYPVWTDGPHVANFYSPLFFWITGLAGAATDASLPQLFQIGRIVTCAAVLASTGFLIGFVWRRYGALAAAVGGTLCLGSAPMIGFAVMARPDLLADCLGVTGFLLTTFRARGAAIAGGGLLVLSILTKQTAAVFLLAAIVASLVEGRRRRAAWLLAGPLAALAVSTLAIVLLLEPHFVPSVLGDARTPFVAGGWREVMGQLLQYSPDLLWFALLGTFVWTYGAPPERELAVFALLVMAASVLSVAKLGASLNYFLALRSVEVLAAGRLCRAAGQFTGRPAWLLTVAVGVCAVVLIPSLKFVSANAYRAQATAIVLSTERGRQLVAEHQEILRMAENPALNILTDSAPVALYQREKAPFLDSFLFRVLVDTGQVQPRRMRERLESKAYDYLILTAELNSDVNPYDEYSFGLPVPLARAAREHYRLTVRKAGLFVYEPGGEGVAP